MRCFVRSDVGWHECSLQNAVASRTLHARTRGIKQLDWRANYRPPCVLTIVVVSGQRLSPTRERHRHRHRCCVSTRSRSVRVSCVPTARCKTERITTMKNGRRLFELLQLREKENCKRTRSRFNSLKHGILEHKKTMLHGNFSFIKFNKVGLFYLIRK